MELDLSISKIFVNSPTRDSLSSPKSPIDNSSKINNSEVNYDITEITRRIFDQKGFVSNDGWTASILVSGKIIKYNSDSVTCECITSLLNGATEVRDFPIILFDHLKPLSHEYPVKIKVSQKKGSIRYDVVDGKNLGIEREFSDLVNWEELNDFQLDDSL